MDKSFSGWIAIFMSFIYLEEYSPDQVGARRTLCADKGKGYTENNAYSLLTLAASGHRKVGGRRDVASGKRGVDRGETRQCLSPAGVLLEGRSPSKWFP